MTRRKVCKLHPPGGEIGVAADDNGVGPLARDRFKSRIDFAPGGGVEDLDLRPLGTSSRFHLSYDRPGLPRIRRIDKHADTNRSGHKLQKKSELLCPQVTRTYLKIA